MDPGDAPGGADRPANPRSPISTLLQAQDPYIENMSTTYARSYGGLSPIPLPLLRTRNESPAPQAATLCWSVAHLTDRPHHNPSGVSQTLCKRYHTPPSHLPSAISHLHRKSKLKSPCRSRTHPLIPPITLSPEALAPALLVATRTQGRQTHKAAAPTTRCPAHPCLTPVTFELQRRSSRGAGGGFFSRLIGLPGGVGWGTSTPASRELG
ncbi:uncharacterized protein N7482_008448 [Penicillium canariense]|uniref:Uncharacterized protein n=1 Tax=Penicillium canariense TaxID=189055 RepID=A0A9W9LIJ9_9EURO|nr:uncharacterized protein N7482_008448 [Penicillium canariense]KAJ5157348.1 hypothetical protein N7482_008448 [Penicillium canariense]